MRSLLIAVGILSPVLMCAQDKFDPAQVERGRATFKSNCGFCHGDDATGNRAPDLVRSTALGHDARGETLAPIIRAGRPSEGMPAFGTLTDAQIGDMVVFLHRQSDLALSSNHVPNDYPLEKLLTGNAAAGKAYFNGVGGCAKCHSVTGDLAGIGNKYPPLELQQRMLWPPKPPKSTVTVKFKNGQVIEGTLVHTDEFNITITNKDGWQQSWDRDKVTVEIHDPLAAHKEMMPKYTDADIHNLFAYLVAQK